MKDRKMGQSSDRGQWSSLHVKDQVVQAACILLSLQLFVTLTLAGCANRDHDPPADMSPGQANDVRRPPDEHTRVDPSMASPTGVGAQQANQDVPTAQDTPTEQDVPEHDAPVGLSPNSGATQPSRSDEQGEAFTLSDAPHQDPAPTVERIPSELVEQAGLRELEGRYLVLYTDLPSGPAIDELPQFVDLAVPQIASYFEIPIEQLAEWQMVGYLIHAKQRFQQIGRFPEWLPDFPTGIQRGDEIWMYEQPEDYYRRHLLLHEVVHCFMDRFLGGGGPIWYREGMAEFLGTHRYEAGELEIAYFPRDRDETPQWGRIRIIRDEYATGHARGLAEILYDPPPKQHENRLYGWSWAACAFFDGLPQTRQPFRALREHARDTSKDFSRHFQTQLGDQWPRLAHLWHAYITELDYGYDLQRNALTTRPTQPLDRPVELEIRADRGWQSTGVQLESGERVRLIASGRYQLGQEPGPWWCEPDGITLHYYRGQPLGKLMAAVIDERQPPRRLSPLARPTPVGSQATLRPQESGTLYVKINDWPWDLANNQGTLQLRIQPSHGSIPTNDHDQ